MGLDLSQIVAQLDALAGRLDGARDDRARRLSSAVRALVEADASEVRQKVDTSQGRPYLCAMPLDGLATRYVPGEIPPDFCVASVDGSHIDVDRHAPARCYLVNVGGCYLAYGSQPEARLFNRPRVYSEEEDLYITSRVPGSMDSVAVDGAVLGLKRAVAEVAALAELAEEAPAGLPLLALVDGSLVLWGVAGRGYQPFVRDEILTWGLVPALDRLWEIGRSRPLAVVAYVSLPQSTEVVNALRLQLCPNDLVECRQACVGYRSTRPPCDGLNGFLDRHLFQELLAPGERSGLFRTNSSVSRDYYGRHQVHFFYLNAGEEIARVEVLQWVAQDEGLVALSHALVLDQCVRGMGYPAAIAEAHEQAVITAPYREAFRQLLEDSLGRARLPVYTSEKARSKRRRWL